MPSGIESWRNPPVFEKTRRRFVGSDCGEVCGALGCDAGDVSEACTPLFTFVGGASAASMAAAPIPRMRAPNMLPRTDREARWRGL
jgi:hypothetical protein